MVNFITKFSSCTVEIDSSLRVDTKCYYIYISSILHAHTTTYYYYLFQRYILEFNLREICAKLWRERATERKSVSLRTPCRQDDREGCGASVRAVARSSLSFLSLLPALRLPHLLTISPPTSLKGDDELAREGKRRKRVNQVECVPEREARGPGGQGK